MMCLRDGRRPLHEYLVRHAQRTPDKVAVVWYGRRITYAELDRASDRFAEVLRRGGIGQGDVVALFLHNCPQYLIAHFGAQKLGAIVSPCNPDAKGYELGHQLGELDACAVVAAEELLPVISASGALERVKRVYAVRYGAWLPALPAIDVPDEVHLASEGRRALPAFAVDFDDACRGVESHSGAMDARVDAPATIAMDDVAMMIYTSGSTGLPKGAMLSFDTALHKTAATAERFEVGADDVILADVALHHIAGMNTGLTLPIYAGATVVLLLRFDATAVLQAIEACRVSFWYTMAPSLPSAMAADDASSYGLASLRAVATTSFGVKLTEELAARWQAFVGGDCAVFEAGYGLSETHSSDTLMPRSAVKWGTNGKPVDGVAVRIVDPDSGAELPTGERGEIVLKGPAAFKGYWLRPDDTAASLLDGGWVRTGDIGALDAEGYLTFIGRRKEMIKVWSYSVFPEEVEAILATHPDVRQAAVVGCPDPDRGEALQAYVVLNAAAAARTRQADAARAGEHIIEWCLQHMSHYKVPRQVILRSGLPSTDTGKLLRRLLGGGGEGQSGLRRVG